MSCCVYDNPATSQRECWQDGKLVVSYKAELFLSKKEFEQRSRRGMKVFFGANVGEFNSGQIVGDISAMPNKQDNGHLPCGP